MPHEVILRAAGLFTDPSEAQTPEGALTTAQNVEIRRPGIIEPRPGFPLDTLPSGLDGYTLHGLVRFGGDLFGAGLNGSNVWTFYNITDSQAVTYSGSPIDFGGTAGDTDRVRFVEQSGSLFLLSDDGILRLDDEDDTAANFAGTPYALLGSASTNSSATTWLANNDAVAYRAVIARSVNNRLLLSRPTGRLVITNTDGANRAVDLTWPLADDVVAGDHLHVYRSPASTSPSDELRLLVDIEVSSTDVSNGYVTYTDQSDDDTWTGASLYTNDTQQGLENGNWRPARAKELASFHGMMFASDLRYPHRLNLEVHKIGGTTATQITDSFQSSASSGDFTDTNDTITNISSSDTFWAAVRVGQYLTEAGGSIGSAGTFIPANTTISSFDQGAGTITMSNAATGTTTAQSFLIHDTLTIGGQRYYAGGGEATSFSVSGTTSEGAVALAHAVNTNSTTVYADVFIVDDQVVVALEKRNLTTSSFSWTSTAPVAFSHPDMVASGNVTSSQESQPGRVSWSKDDQPDSWPLGYYQDVGSKDKAVLRTIPTRNSLFIMKEDGVWVLTGETPESIRIDPWDQNTVLLTRDAACALHNRVWAWTNKGVVSMAESGSLDVSSPIDFTLRDLERDLLNGAASSTGTFCVGHENAERFVLCIRKALGTPDVEIYVYNTRTSAWTGPWEMSSLLRVRCAFTDDDGDLCFGGDDFVNAALGREVLDGDGDANVVNYDDKESVTVDSWASSTRRVTLSGSISPAPAAGDLLVDSGGAAWPVTAFVSSTVFEVGGTGDVQTGAGDYYRFFEVDIVWSDRFGGGPSIDKRYRWYVDGFESYRLLHKVENRFTSDRVSTEATLYHDSLIPTTPANSTVEQPAGVLRGLVSADHARCTRLRPRVRVANAGAEFAISSLALAFDPISERV